MKPESKIDRIIVLIKDKINAVREGDEYSMSLEGCADINRTDIYSDGNLNNVVNIRAGRGSFTETTGEWTWRREINIDVIGRDTSDVMLMLVNVLKVVSKNVAWDGLAVETELGELEGPVYDNDGVKLADESILLTVIYKTKEWEL